MKVYEIEHTLDVEERRTLLFLTGGMKLIKSSEISSNELWNLQEFFGYNKTNKRILKTIIFKDKVVTKIKEE